MIGFIITTKARDGIERDLETDASGRIGRTRIKGEDWREHRDPLIVVKEYNPGIGHIEYPHHPTEFKDCKLLVSVSGSPRFEYGEVLAIQKRVK